MNENISSLLCDTGGTHARFARFVKPGHYTDFKKYRLSDYKSYEDIIQAYLEEHDFSSCSARFAMARTPVDGVIKEKRFAGDPDYEIDFNKIKKRFGWSECHVLNDLEAAGWGLFALRPDQTTTVINAKGSSYNSNKILISIGTGIGHCLIADKQVFKSCGGHFHATPVTKTHRDFATFVREQKKDGTCLIAEDLISGRGLKFALAFFSGTLVYDKDDNEFLEALSRHPDAVTLFFELLGVHAHILTGATGFYGGVYLAGGVIDILIDNGMTDWTGFKKTFRPEMISTMNTRLNNCPVEYILHDEMPLLGLSVIEI